MLADHSIVAVVYGAGRSVDALMRRVVQRLRERGQRCAGYVQVDVPRPGRSRCSMRLENLTTGATLPISEDRGPLARGCQLDVSQLLAGMEATRGELATRPDLLVINKFGKSEAEGGGFRPLIADAIELGVPVLIGVPWRNIEPWRLFTGGLSAEYPIEALVDEEDEIVLTRLGFGAPASARSTIRPEATP